jgi:hypothetical protein
VITEIIFFLYFLVTLSKDDTPMTAAAIAARTTPPATTDNNVFFKEGVIAAVSLIASVMAKEGATKLAVLRETAALIFSTLFATFDILATGVADTLTAREPERRRVDNLSGINPDGDNVHAMFVNYVQIMKFLATVVSYFF